MKWQHTTQQITQVQSVPKNLCLHVLWRVVAFLTFGVKHFKNIAWSKIYLRTGKNIYLFYFQGFKTKMQTNEHK